MSKIAVIQFPGSNCIKETIAALHYVGAEADVIRWNCDSEIFHSYAAYILPGGFSYQDRVRAGAISAKLPIMSELIKANEDGKAILGICNGCQILAESGLVPDYTDEQALDMALAPNTAKGSMMGFVCDWVHVSVESPEKSLFTTCFSTDDIIPIPINHGEGRFVFSILPNGNHAKMRYITSKGDAAHTFPENPNGSTDAIAGLSNKKGNVFAMMPHPERAYLSQQVPRSLNTPWKENSVFGPWYPLFKSLKEHIEG